MLGTKVVILPHVYAKINYFVQNSSIEVSGMGKVKQSADGTFVVIDAILLDQENTSSDTEICAKALGKAMFELKDTEGHLNFWWHSHVNMGVFWSGTDHQAIRQLGKHGWILSTVFNKKCQMKSAYYQKGDGFMPELFYDDIQTAVSATITKEEQDKWAKELEVKAKPKKYELPTKYVWDLEGDDFVYDEKFGGYVPNRNKKSKKRKAKAKAKAKTEKAAEQILCYADLGVLMKVKVDSWLSQLEEEYVLVTGEGIDYFDVFCQSFGAMPLGYEDLDYFLSGMEIDHNQGIIQ